MMRPLPVAIALMGVLIAVKAGSLATHSLWWGRVVPSAVAATSTGEPGREHASDAAKAEPGKSEPAKSEPGRPAPVKAGGGKATEVPLAAKPPSPPLAPPPPPPPSEAELKLLTDLRGRRTAIDGREQALATRESTVAAAEQRLTARVGELESLQSRLEALETARRNHDEANWRGLVRTYEAMKPKEAAVIMTELDDAVLLPVLDRMKEAKAAPILTAMPADRARAVTAQLAQMRTRANTPAPAASSGG